MALNPREKDLNTVEDAVEIDIEDPVPYLDRRLVRGAATTDAGVVADDMHLLEGFLGLIGGTLDGGTVGDIQHEGDQVPGAIQFLLGFRQVLLCGYPRWRPSLPLFKERLRHAQSDAACTTRDERHLAFEILHA